MNQLSTGSTPTPGAVQTPTPQTSTPVGPMQQGWPGAGSMTIAKGATVLDVRGEKVGTALEYDALNQYLRVEHGWLVPVLLHVPLYAITRSDAKHIQLAVSKDDALNGHWPAPAMSAPADTSAPVNLAYVGVNLAVGNGNGAQATVAAAGTAMTMPGNGTTTPRTSITLDAAAAAGRTTIGALPAAVAQGQGPDETEVRLPVVEERLVVAPRREQVGVVRVHKEVVEMQQTVPVTLRHEVVSVEYVPAAGEADPATAATAFTAQDIVMPVMAERAAVSTEARVVEEVRVHKQSVAEEHAVSGTVRKTRVSVDGPVGNAA